MMPKTQLVLALAAVLLAISVAGRSLRQENPLSGLTSGRFSQDNSQDNTQEQKPAESTDVITDEDPRSYASYQSSSWVAPPPSNYTWPVHNYTKPENVTVQIVIKKEEKKKEEKKEEIPECSDAAASCCHQTINVIPVDEHTNVPLPGQNCTYSETITKIITPACADMHCLHCGHCAEKAVVETYTVNKTLNLLTAPYPPAVWAVKEHAYCVCPHPVEQKVTVTASASVSDGHH